MNNETSDFKIIIFIIQSLIFFVDKNKGYIVVKDD